MASENDVGMYEAQLLQVEEAITQCSDDEERKSLRSLQNNLRELIALTLEALAESQNTWEHFNNNGASGSEPTEPKPNWGHSSRWTADHDDEMSLFMQEIRQLDREPSECTVKKNEQPTQRKLYTLKEFQDKMLGEKFSAPFDNAWSGRTYHNAVVCAVDNPICDNNSDHDQFTEDSFKLRVFYANPIHKKMIPCSYFLNSDCKFDADKCHFSHGELIQFQDLKQYKEPDFTKLKKNCHVLAKMDDELWCRGKVLSADFDKKSCTVQLDQEKKINELNFEHLFPINDGDNTDDSNSDSDSSCLDDTDEEGDNAFFVQQSLMSIPPNQAFGDWEKHTKGIGSKLLQKMGYIVGNGLGRGGSGITEPVSAQILPVGKSLDYCMNLREAAEGRKDFFNADRHLKRLQKKQEAINDRAYEREKNKTDVFSFLNKNVLSDISKVNNSINTDLKTGTISKRKDFKNHTTKKLNVESLKLFDDIRHKEKEIDGLRTALKRHEPNSEYYKRLQNQLIVKKNDLHQLHSTERNVAREQMSRKHKDKLSIF